MEKEEHTPHGKHPCEFHKYLPGVWVEGVVEGGVSPSTL